MFKIIKYSREYRDDMLFCYLSAKDALGGIPRLSDDLLDIQKHYFDKNDMFWIAVNDNNRVIGMVGTDTVSETDIWLKRLFVKPEIKRNGVAGALLNIVVAHAKSRGITSIHTRFSDNYIEASHFYPAKGFIESGRSDGLRHFIKTI
jgi:GNAT superfamily N-acetyltransferase